MIDLMTPVSEMMTDKLITVNKQTPLSEVKQLFERHQIHHLPVIESDILVGMVSMTDYLYHLKADCDNVKTLPSHSVSEIMTTGIAVVEPSDRLGVALKILRENTFHAIPVVKDKRLQGIITPLDIINALLEKDSVLN